MKRLIVTLAVFLALCGCNDQLHGSGAVEPRSKGVDSGALLPSARDNGRHPLDTAQLYSDTGTGIQNKSHAR